MSRVYVSAIEDDGLENLFGGPCTVYGLYADAGATGGADFLRIYDHAEPTLGTTKADFSLKIEASENRIFPMPWGEPFPNGFSMACGGTKGDTIGAAPGASIAVVIWGRRD